MHNKQLRINPTLTRLKFINENGIRYRTGMRTSIKQATMVKILLLLLLENVEHCGGEPEQADTGISCHW